MRPLDRQNDRLKIPLMFAFRDAFEKRDATLAEEVRIDGERVIADRGALRRGASEALLKRDLAIDLSSLAETIDLGSAVELGQLPYVAKSVLNYGLPELSRVAADSEAVDTVGTDLREALLRHEPRLSKSTLSVHRVEGGDDANQRIRFKVHADLICRPLDIPVEFVAEVDVALGKVLLPRLPGAT